MNRSNVGNIVTNAQQVLSVGAFTAGGYRRSLAKAEQTLNNRAKSAEGTLSPEDEARYRAMKSGKKMEAVRRWETASDDPYRLLSDKEASDVTAKKAEKLKEFAYGKDEEEPKKPEDKTPKTVDEAMSGVPPIEDSSEQSSEVIRKVDNDMKWLEKRTSKSGRKYIFNKETGKIGGSWK